MRPGLFLNHNNMVKFIQVTSLTSCTLIKIKKSIAVLFKKALFPPSEATHSICFIFRQGEQIEASDPYPLCSVAERK